MAEVDELTKTAKPRKGGSPEAQNENYYQKLIDRERSEEERQLQQRSREA
jgi:hypothetical protein